MHDSKALGMMDAEFHDYEGKMKESTDTQKSILPDCPFSVVRIKASLERQLCCKMIAVILA